MSSKRLLVSLLVGLVLVSTGLYIMMTGNSNNSVVGNNNINGVAQPEKALADDKPKSVKEMDVAHLEPLEVAELKNGEKPVAVLPSEEVKGPWIKRISVFIIEKVNAVIEYGKEKYVSITDGYKRLTPVAKTVVFVSVTSVLLAVIYLLLTLIMHRQQRHTPDIENRTIVSVETEHQEKPQSRTRLQKIISAGQNLFLSFKYLFVLAFMTVIVIFLAHYWDVLVGKVFDTLDFFGITTAFASIYSAALFWIVTAWTRLMGMQRFFMI